MASTHTNQLLDYYRSELESTQTAIFRRITDIHYSLFIFSPYRILRACHNKTYSGSLIAAACYFHYAVGSDHYHHQTHSTRTYINLHRHLY